MKNSIQLTKIDFNKVVMVALFCTITQIILYIFIPSLPAITHSLHITAGVAQLTVVLFLIPLGISQLFYGPISDTFGRRKIILIGLIAAIIGSIIIVFSKSIYGICSGRFIQGIGGGALTLMGRVVLSDYFTKKKLTIAMGYLAASVGLIPAIVPSIGGGIQDLLGWRFIFVFLAIYISLILAVTYFHLPETKKINKAATLKLTKVFTNYCSLFKNSRYLAYISCVLLSYLCFVLALIISPFVFQNIFGLSAVQFGVILLAPFIFSVLGNLTSNILNYKLHMHHIIIMGITMLFIAGLLLLSIALLHEKSELLFLAAFCIITFGVGLIFANATSGFMQEFPKYTGVATAVSGTLQLTGSGLIGIVISTFNLENTFDLALGVLICTLLLIGLITYLRHFEKAT